MMENGSYSSSSEISPVSSIAPSDDVEVKKLKDLVKKLEKQNEHLRHRTGKLNSSANKLTKSKVEYSVAGGDAAPNHRLSSRLSRNVTDDIQLLDENDQDFLNVSLGDELSWLYTSPKAPSSEPISSRHLSPHDWLKEEFEHPRTPQLSSAKRNIMYKLDGAYGDRNSSDMSYLRRSIEKRLVFPVDDYKMESPTMRNASDLAENSDTSNRFKSNYNESQETPPSASLRVQRRSSYDDVDEEQDRDPTSQGFPNQSHHLPVPSQTMTTAHGLYPAHVDDEVDGERNRRSHTPTRQERTHEPSERVGISQRSRSPARKSSASGPVRRSLPNTSRLLQALSPNSSPGEILTRNDRQQNIHQPVIKSSLVAPPRMSRLQQKSVLPTPGASSGVPSVGKAMHRGRSSSPMTSQRRSLPRPSQTTTSMKYSSKPSPVAPRSVPQKPSIPPSDIWGDDDEVY